MACYTLQNHVGSWGGLIWVGLRESSLLSLELFFAAIKGTTSMVVFSVEGALALGFVDSKVKLLYVPSFENVDLSTISDLQPIESRIIFVIRLKNCSSVASWSVEVNWAVKSSYLIVLAGFSVMVGAVGIGSPVGSKIAS